MIPRTLKINISYSYNCCFYSLTCPQSILFHTTYEDVCYHLINFIHWISDVFKPRDPSCSWCSLHFMGHSVKLLVYIHALPLLLEPWMFMTHFRFISVQPDNFFVPFLKRATTHHHPQSSSLKWACNIAASTPYLIFKIATFYVPSGPSDYFSVPVETYFVRSLVRYCR